MDSLGLDDRTVSMIAHRKAVPVELVQQLAAELARTPGVRSSVGLLLARIDAHKQRQSGKAVSFLADRPEPAPATDREAVDAMRERCMTLLRELYGQCSEARAAEINRELAAMHSGYSGAAKLGA